MIFTITTLARSLADYLEPVMPGVTMYEDPNQQGTETPAMFLQQRYGSIKKQLDGYYLRTLGLDLTYLEDYNLTDLQQKYQRAGEALDLVMETFPYTDPYTDEKSDSTEVIRAFDRSWTIDLDALHYKFEVRVRVTPEEAAVLMKRADLTIEVKEAEQNG